MKRSVFLYLNFFWALIAMAVAVDAPERVAVNVPERVFSYVQSWIVNPPPVPTDSEVQASLAAAALPKEFADVIASLHRRDLQKGTDGLMHQIDWITGIPMRDGLQIYDVVRKIKPKKTLEIGFAYGVSTMYFLAGLRTNGFGAHTAIDPFEETQWNGIGLMKVKEVGMQRSFEFMPERSHPALARLADRKQLFEIIFIDGAHLYDIAFADFVLADAVCTKGCYILLHDRWMSSVQRIISFIEKNRLDYSRRESSTPNIAIFQKTGDDKRPWNHFEPF
jgi:predicted O-methyltransferase YrrM